MEQPAPMEWGDRSPYLMLSGREEDVDRRFGNARCARRLRDKRTVEVPETGLRTYETVEDVVEQTCKRRLRRPLKPFTYLPEQ